MKELMIIVLALTFTACSSLKKGRSVPPRDSLKQISWIEGNWMGLYNGKPFFEIYKLTDPHTLKITSYSWNGTDSSASTYSFIKYFDGQYFLGDSLNWKVTSITDTSIYMIPNNKASNSILWKRRGTEGWDAILGSAGSEQKYTMEPIRHFKDQ